MRPSPRLNRAPHGGIPVGTFGRSAQLLPHLRNGPSSFFLNPGYGFVSWIMAIRRPAGWAAARGEPASVCRAADQDRGRAPGSA